MKLNNLLKGWDGMRLFRLVLGILIAIQAVVALDLFAGIIGAFLLYQAIANIGCCGVGACAIPEKPDPIARQEISNIKP